MYENGHPVVRNVPAKEDVINILHNHQVPSSQATRFSQNNPSSLSRPTNSRILTAGSQIIKKEIHISPSKSKLPPSSPILEDQEKKKKNREHSHHRHHHHHHHHSKSPIDTHSSTTPRKHVPHPPHQPSPHSQHLPGQPPRYSNPYSYPVYPPRQPSYSNPYYSGGGLNANGNPNYISPPFMNPHQQHPATAIPPPVVQPSLSMMPYNNNNQYLPYQYPIQPPQPPPISYSNPNNLDKELFSQLKDMLTQQQELQTTKLINQQLTREIENERQQNQLNLLLEQKRLVEQQRNEMNEKINDLKSFVKEQIQEKPLRFQGNNANNNQFGDDLIIPYHPLPSLPPTPTPNPPAPPQYYPQQQPQYPLQPMPQPFMPAQPQQPQQSPYQPALPSVVTNPPVVPGPTPIKSIEDIKFPHNNPYLNPDKWKKNNNNNSNNNPTSQPQPQPQPQPVQNVPTFQPVKNETPKPVDRVEYKANININYMTCNVELDTPICEVRVVRHDNYDNPKDIFICERTHNKDGRYIWNQGAEGVVFVSTDYDTMLLRVLDGQYNLLYWGAVPIFHIEKNKIDTLDATITLPLYDPPDWTNYEQKVVSKDNPNIEFTVSKNDIIIQQKLTDQMKEPFIPYHRCFDYHEIFQDTDGADIYIDGLRSLPDCVTITKVVALIATESYEIIMKSENKICDLDELRYDPYFDMKLAFRPTDKLNGSATLIIRIDTVEEDTKEIRSIGYSFFPLFVKAENDYSQPDSDDKNYILRTGNFQIRVHPLDYAFRKDPVRESEEPILSSGIYPCTTITLRVRPANKKKDNTRCYYFEEYEKHGFSIEKRLDYSNSCYDTRMCDEIGLEAGLYFARKNRPNLRLSESYDKMMDEETLTKLNYNKDSIAEHLAKILNNKPKQLINPSLVVVGNIEKIAIQICVESIFGYDKKYALKVSHILIPYHEEYFKSKANIDKLKYTKKSNWDSRIGSICFDTNTSDNHVIKYDQKATIIFQLYTVSDYGKVVEIGWSALPVFYENSKSVLFGKYLTAVFKEEFDYEFVNEFNSMSFDEVMKKHIKKCKGISILVKINDLLLNGFLNPNYYAVSNRYLPNDGSKDPYKKWMNEIPQGDNSRKSIYTTIMPKKYGTDTDAYEKMTNEAMEKYLGIHDATYQ